MAIGKFTFLYPFPNEVDLEIRVGDFGNSGLPPAPSHSPSLLPEGLAQCLALSRQQRVTALLPHHFILTEFLLHAQHGKDY